MRLVFLIPGRISWANARVGGNVASRPARPASTLLRFAGSSATSVFRPADCDASAAKNVLKLGNSSLRSCSWTFNAAVTLPIEAISFERSCGSVPVIACASIAPPRSDAGPRA